MCAKKFLKCPQAGLVQICHAISGHQELQKIVRRLKTQSNPNYIHFCRKPGATGVQDPAQTPLCESDKQFDPVYPEGSLPQHDTTGQAHSHQKQDLQSPR